MQQIQVRPKDENFVVVEDPKRKYIEGELVKGMEVQPVVQRGGAVLPVISDLFREGAGAYIRRGWGKGLSLHHPAPKFLSPATLFCEQRSLEINWIAKVFVEPEMANAIRAGTKAQGFLRMAPGGTSQNPNRCGFTQSTPLKQFPEVGPSDLFADPIAKAEYFLIGGRGSVQIPGDGTYSFSLYGYGPGFRVAWFALSQT